MVLVVASMTGVLRIPRALMPGHGLPVPACPMLCIQSVAPVVSSSAYTMFDVVTAKNLPLPGVMLARKTGDALMAPEKVALNVVSSAIFGALASVRFGSMK